MGKGNLDFLYFDENINMIMRKCIISRARQLTL